MNDFQKRALAYHAYRALRKLAALNKKAEEGQEPTPTNRAKERNFGGEQVERKAPKPKGPVIAQKRDWWNRIPKRSSGKGGCCGK